jgi:ERF superfamily
MSDEADQPGTALVPADPVSTGNMLTAFMSALTDPRVDAAKMPVVADTLMKLATYEREAEFSRDKAAAVAAMPVIDRKGRIVMPGKNGGPDRLQSRYSRWEDIHIAITPVLTAHRLVLTHSPGHVDKMPAVAAVLTHANGFSERSDYMPLPLDTSGNKNNTQGVGSALSYGQRYTTILMLNIRQQNVDDDGQAAGGSGGGRALTEAQQTLLDEANDAARRGLQAYTNWFQDRSPAEKGWLVYEGKHDQLKQAAEGKDQ